MFESDNSQLFLTAGMIHNRRVAHEQANRADHAEAYARNATAYVRELEARVIALKEEAATAEGTLEAWQAQCRRLQSELSRHQVRIRQAEQSEAALRIAMEGSRTEARQSAALASGYLAVIRAYEAAHPDSPLAKPVSHDWAGKPTSGVQAVFDSAYAKAREQVSPSPPRPADPRISANTQKFIGQDY